jgi:hypothetical protein
LKPITAAIVFVLALTPFAAAANETTWLDASGQFSIALQPNGWIADAAPLSDGDVLSARDQNGSGRCDLSFLGRAGPPVSREQLNAGIRNIEASAREREGTVGLQVLVTEVDGVAVVDSVGEVGGLSTITRRFGIYHAGSGRMYSLICSVDRTDSDGVSRMQAVASSLAFLPEQ